MTADSSMTATKRNPPCSMQSPRFLLVPFSLPR